MAEENKNVCYFNKYGFCKFKLTCRKYHNMKICSNKSCEKRLCSLRHPKPCRYYREIGYCKFGEWCLFQHEDSNKRNIEEAVKKLDAKMDAFEKCLNEEDNEILKLAERINFNEEKMKFLEEKINNLVKDDASTELDIN